MNVDKCSLQVVSVINNLLATNAASKHSFSTLRRVKSYLRSAMTQSRLNHLMILHYHQDLRDKLDLNSVANEYISKNDSKAHLLH